ncbi:MAG: acylphosphatase [Planctomycetes bacterium]|jgi:acylphosphatase|nr:acylphosphatase [Planctomycetota bacterium]
MPRITAHFTGHVQGVGFRATTDHVARRHDVTGTVENLPDGRVRLVAEGEQKELDAFLRDVQQAMARYIQHTTTDPDSATGEFPDFRIKH